MNAPCFRCEERQVGCHGKCEKYIQFDLERKAERHLNNIRHLEAEQLKNRRRAAKILLEKNAITREVGKGKV